MPERITTQKETLAPTSSKPVQEKIGGVDFWMMVCFALVVDLSSLLVLMGDAFGLAAQVVPVLGNLVGIAVIATAIGLNFILNLVYTATLFLFFFFKRVNISMEKLGLQVATMLIEQFPLVNILPFTTLTLFVIRYLENKRRSSSGLLGKGVQLVASGVFRG